MVSAISAWNYAEAFIFFLFILFFHFLFFSLSKVHCYVLLSPGDHKIWSEIQKINHLENEISFDFKKKKDKRFIMYYRPCIGNKSFPSASNLYVTGILLPVEYGYQSHIFEIHSISNEKPWIMIK